MLYIFYGTDEDKARTKLRATLSALQKKAPDAHVLRVSDEDVEGVNMEVLLSAQGLFYAKRVVVFDKALALKGARAHVVARLKDMATSEHIFLVIEGTVDAELEKQFKKHATKCELCGETKKEKKEDKANWDITNAFARKDMRGMWIALQRSLARGITPEQIHGQLFWKAKQLLLASRVSQTSAEVGLLAELAELPHEARRRGVELEYALERFTLIIGK